MLKNVKHVFFKANRKNAQINAKCGRQANVQHKQNKMQTKEHKLNQQQQQKQTIEVENENV